MPFIPAVNCVRVTVDYLSANGESAANVMHFRCLTGLPTETNIEDLFDLLYNWYDTAWDSAASTDWQTDLFTARRLSVVDDIVATRVVTVNGTVTGGAQPGQNTIAMSARTGLAGPSRRGRIFHVGLPKSYTIGSTIQSSPSAQLLATYSALLTQLAASDWEYVICSFYFNNAPRVTAQITPVTNFILTDVIVDSMDSRKPEV